MVSSSSSHRSGARLALLVVAVAAAVVLPGVRAIHYTSRQDGGWTNASTWSPSGVPGAGDTVSIIDDHVTFPCPPPSNVTTVRTVQALTLGGTARLWFAGTHDDPAFPGVTCELRVETALHISPLGWTTWFPPFVKLGPSMQLRVGSIVFDDFADSRVRVFEFRGLEMDAPAPTSANYGRLMVASGLIDVLAPPSRAGLGFSHYLRVVATGPDSAPLRVQTTTGEPIECSATQGVVFERIANPFHCRLTGPSAGLVSVTGGSTAQAAVTIPSVHVLGGVLQLDGQVRVEQSCSPPSNPCSSGPCANGGTCSVNATGSAVCQCPAAFQGQYCQFPVATACSSNPCVHGVCNVVGGGEAFACTCAAGWTGLTCATPVPAASACDSSPCQNQGTCSNTPGGGYTCACQTTYYFGTYFGAQCQYGLSCPSGAYGHLCRPHGRCVGNATTGASHCECDEGWTGPGCAQDVVNPCYRGREVCSYHGTCVNGTAGATSCTCDVGWAGERCDERLPDVCWPANPCSKGWCQLSDNAAGFTCVCPPGWVGADCERYEPPCDAHPCGQAVACMNREGGAFLCVCREGWTGQYCDVPTTTCDVNPCWSGGNCYLNSTGGRACNCPPGFSGEWCQVNVNECASDPCLGGAQCIDRPNGYYCAVPLAIAFNPAPGASNLAVNFTTLQIAFDQSRMAAGDGVVAVYRLDTMAIRLLFPADPSYLTLGLDGTSATNVATFALPTGVVSRPLTTYAVVIGGDAFVSANGGPFAGVPLGAWNFTTGPLMPPEYLMHPTDAVQFALQFALPFDALAFAGRRERMPRALVHATATAALAARTHWTGVKAVATPTSDVEEAVASGQALDLNAPSAAVATVVAQLVQLAAEALDVPAARVRVAALDRAANGETIVTFEFVPAPAAEQQTEASPTGLMAQLRALVQTQGSAFYTTLNALGGPTFSAALAEVPTAPAAAGAAPGGSAAAPANGSGSGSGGLTTTAVVIIALSCAVVALSATAFVLYRRLTVSVTPAPKAKAANPKVAQTELTAVTSPAPAATATATAAPKADVTLTPPPTPRRTPLPPAIPAVNAV